MTLLSLFFGTSILAATPVADRVTPPLDFWLAPFEAESFVFPPAENLPLSPWQTAYAVKDDAVEIGGRVYTAKDRPFPTGSGLCRKVEFPDDFAASFVTYCAGNGPSKSTAVRVVLNEHEVPGAGGLVLNSSQAMELSFEWPGGQILRLHLLAPDEGTYDILPRNTGGWTVYETRGPYQPRGRLFDSGTLPWSRVVRQTEIRKLPWTFVRKDFDGILFRRVLVNTENLPDREVRPRARFPGTLGSYGTSFTFDVDGGKVAPTWRVTGEDFGSYVVQIGDAQTKFRVPVVSMRSWEVGAHASAAVSNIGFVGTAELGFSHHFENPFGSAIEDWHSHRWAVRARSFQIVYSTAADARIANTTSFTEGQIQCNLRQGLWNRDEVWGILGGVSQFHMINDMENMLSLGGFWGRSMPEIFDHWLRKFSWLNHPKYVDLDVSFLKPQSRLNNTLDWSANFHGKMFLTQQVYLDGGASLFQLYASPNQGFSTLVGTVGIGSLF